jgi:cellobiose phosphorylase
MIDPAIPSEWKSFKVNRTYRGTKYIIEIQNPDNVENGVKSIFIDGEEIEGNIITPSEKKVVKVKVVMGKKNNQNKKVKVAFDVEKI